jgi:hypothetical protein
MAHAALEQAAHQAAEANYVGDERELALSIAALVEAQARKLLLMAKPMQKIDAALS